MSISCLSLADNFWHQIDNASSLCLNFSEYFWHQIDTPDHFPPGNGTRIQAPDLKRCGNIIICVRRYLFRLVKRPGESRGRLAYSRHPDFPDPRYLLLARGASRLPFRA